MKKFLVLSTILSLLCCNGYSQLFTFTFTGAATCPTPGTTLSPQPTNVSVGTISRNGALTCNSTADVFNTATWPTQTTINTTQYIEFSVTAAAGYQVNFNSVSFITQRSSTGPVSGRIAHDGGIGTFSSNYDFTATTSNSTVSWDFTDFVGASGVSVKFRIYGWGASGSGGTLRLDDLTMNATVSADVASSLWLKSANGNNLFNNNPGSVYIGLTAPNSLVSPTDPYKLFVENGIRTRKLKVDAPTITWPDYVFGDTYVLPTLKEVEQYLKKNSHLIGVPSAEEIQKDGIDVGTNQAILLHKIEELTLYILEQNQKNLEQQEQINELKKQVLEIKSNTTRKTIE